MRAVDRHYRGPGRGFFPEAQQHGIASFPKFPVLVVTNDAMENKDVGGFLVNVIVHVATECGRRASLVLAGESMIGAWKDDRDVRVSVNPTPAQVRARLRAWKVENADEVAALIVAKTTGGPDA